MDESRNTNTTNNSKGVHKRGEGLGTGPVGRTDGYQGRKDSGNGSGAKRAGGGKMSLLTIIIVLLLGGGGGLGALLGGGGSAPDTSYVQESTVSNQNGNGYGNSTGTGNTPGGSTGQGTGASSSVGQSVDLFSLFGGGFAGQQVSSGWQGGVTNTAKLDETVAPGAEPKRTTILGNGKDTVTIMVYMCGTDLESKYGMASNDIKEMAAANLSDNINIIIYTGGCSEWKLNGISNTKNQIYKITNHSLERLVENDGDKSMTDPATLTSFINYCKENYPANRNDLIFWDHGGGSLTGYGYDEKHKSAGSMKLAQIDSALKKADIKFDFIGFDACLMATLENGYMCANYADYLIASEETEPGIGWYYTTWLNELSKNTSMPTVQIGKNIVDGFVDECARSCQGQKTTLSVVDLAELKATVPDSLMNFSKSTSSMIQGDQFKQVSDARASVREFSSKIDQIDLVNFAENIGTKEAQDLANKLLGAVKYNRTSSNMTNAYGISIYFPYRKASNVNNAVSMNNTVGIDGAYNDCIKAFAGLETSGQIAAGGSQSPLSSLLGGSIGSGSTGGQDAISGLLNAFLSGGREIPGVDRDMNSYLEDTDIEAAAQYISLNQFDGSKLLWNLEADGSHTISLPAEQWQMVQSIQQNMFYDDGEGFIDMGLDNVFRFTEDGKLVGDTDNTWIAIDGQPVAYYYDGTIIASGDGSVESAAGDSSNKIITGHVPVILNGTDRAVLIINFDASNPNGYIAGARFDYSAGDHTIDDENRTAAKGITELTPDTTIDFICDYYSYAGDYLDSYFLGEQVTYSAGMQISNVDVMGTTKITYLFTDMYNNEFWTEAITQK